MSDEATPKPNNGPEFTLTVFGDKEAWSKFSFFNNNLYLQVFKRGTKGALFSESFNLQWLEAFRSTLMTVVNGKPAFKVPLIKTIKNRQTGNSEHVFKIIFYKDERGMIGMLIPSKAGDPVKVGFPSPYGYNSGNENERSEVSRIGVDAFISWLNYVAIPFMGNNPPIKSDRPYQKGGNNNYRNNGGGGGYNKSPKPEEVAEAFAESGGGDDMDDMPF